MIKVIEYNKKYDEDIKDLLVELEEYIVSIDKDNLDQIGPDYRNNMINYLLENVKSNDGKCYLAISDNKVVGLIMGIITKYEPVDYLDYKCPKKGRITELVITQKIRNNGIGNKLINIMEEYFKSQDCEYISIEVFAYNENAINFYIKNNYHARCIDLIKKVE